MSSKTCGIDLFSIRPLTKNEIDERIDNLTAQLAESAGADGQAPDEEICPRWISAADLVRHMQSFVVLN